MRSDHGASFRLCPRVPVAGNETTGRTAYCYELYLKFRCRRAGRNEISLAKKEWAKMIGIHVKATHPSRDHFRSHARRRLRSELSFLERLLESRQSGWE